MTKTEAKEAMGRKNNSGFMILIIGVFLVFADFAVMTPLSYGYEHVSEEGSSRFFYKEFLKQLMGGGVTCDLFISIVGYGLLIAGCMMLRKYHKRFITAAVVSVMGAVSYTAYALCPFYADGTTTIKLSIALLVVWLVCQCGILFNVYIGIQKQVDSFYHIEVRKDLYFGFETVILCLITSKIMRMFYWMPFGNVAYYVLWLGMHAGLVYFVVKAVKYKKSLQMFE